MKNIMTETGNRSTYNLMSDRELSGSGMKRVRLNYGGKGIELNEIYSEVKRMQPFSVEIPEDFLLECKGMERERLGDVVFEINKRSENTNVDIVDDDEFYTSRTKCIKMVVRKGNE